MSPPVIDGFEFIEIENNRCRNGVLLKMLISAIALTVTTTLRSKFPCAPDDEDREIVPAAPSKTVTTDTPPRTQRSISCDSTKRRRL